ncbi:MAG: nucleotidyltransferase [Gammaproteobacteria bacterium]
MAMHELHADFKDFLKLLNEHKVRYLIVGGYAVAYHGYVRATGDLDLFFAASKANAAGLVKVLNKFGFELPQIRSALFLRPKSLIRLGHEPVKLELMNDISGISFRECYRHRVLAMVDGLQLPFIALDQLLINKRATGRTKDRADAEELEKLLR